MWWSNFQIHGDANQKSTGRPEEDGLSGRVVEDENGVYCGWGQGLGPWRGESETLQAVRMAWTKVRKWKYKWIMQGTVWEWAGKTEVKDEDRKMVIMMVLSNVVNIHLSLGTIQKAIDVFLIEPL